MKPSPPHKEDFRRYFDSLINLAPARHRLRVKCVFCLQGYDNLVKKIVSLHDLHKKTYCLQYDVSVSVKEALHKVLADVESNRVVSVSKLQELTDDVFEGFGHVYKQAAKILHKMVSQDRGM